MSKSFEKKLWTYLTVIGVDLTMLDLLHLAPPSSIHNFSPDEMKSTGLVTDYDTARELVTNSLCAQAVPADNCVKL
jgi:hypothetical protein